MTYTKADALCSLKPNAKWFWKGDSYSDIKWDSKETIPTEDEINAELTRLTNTEPLRLLRKERNRRLLNSDWTQSRDITLSNDAEWKTYRQALRDLPANTADPTNPTWPTQPN
tara:strand:+ start:208 stop:546 length:339 start_codon:yes stop_codon:yes gene_type:complete